MPWRRSLFALHRDIGFVCLGLTLVYAISGVAVNHRHHWDYNRSTAIETYAIGAPAKLLEDRSGKAPGALAREREELLVERIRVALGRPDRPRKAFWRGRDRLSLFFGAADGDVVDYSPAKGLAEWTLRRDRPVLRQFNLLHLNERPVWWTYLADLYAVALAFLAISGVLIVRGRRGLRGRGGVLLLIGLALPLLALWLL